MTEEGGGGFSGVGEEEEEEDTRGEEDVLKIFPIYHEVLVMNNTLMTRV